MAVAVRIGLRRFDDPVLGAFATATVALAVTVVIGVAATAGESLHASDLWPFVLAGAIAPGLSQVLFTLAVSGAGAARTAVLMGTAPLVSVAIALVALHEPLRVPLLVGAALIVAGGIALAGERVRPADFRRLGIVFALLATLMFAIRDNLLRWLSGHTEAHALVTAPVTMLAGAADGCPLPRRHARPRLGPRLRPGGSRLLPRRAALRPLVRGAVRGLLPRARDGGLAARRDRVALGRALRGAAPAAERARRPAPRRRSRPDRRGRRAHRRVAIIPAWVG